MFGQITFFAILGAIAAVVSIVMAFARTSPDDAASNLSKWAAKIGVRGLPRWAQRKSADFAILRYGHYVLIGCVACFVIFALIFRQNAPVIKTITAGDSASAPPSGSPRLPKRALSSSDKQFLVQKFLFFRGHINTVVVNRSSYASGSLFIDLAEVFNRAGVAHNHVQTGFQDSISPNETGVMICTTNPDRPSEDENVLQKWLAEVGIQTKFIPLSEAMYRGDLTIFVGPDPL